MNIFFDTSSLLKLYHNETGTENTEKVFAENNVRQVFISGISTVEFSSAVWKKVRTGELTKEQAKELIEALKADEHKYTFVEVNNPVLETARKLIAKYGSKGLRTLDGIQLASAVSLKDKCDKHITADKLLNDLFREEGLKTL